MNGNILQLAKALPQESLMGLELSGSVQRVFNSYAYTWQMAVPAHSRYLSKSLLCYRFKLMLSILPHPDVVGPACIMEQDCPGED